MKLPWVSRKKFEIATLEHSQSVERFDKMCMAYAELTIRVSILQKQIAQLEKEREVQNMQMLAMAADFAQHECGFKYP